MASNEEVLTRFLTESGRKEPRFLHRGVSLFVGKQDSVLFFDPLEQGRRGRRTELLARFIGDHYDKRGFMLLNGDGFENRDATAWQTRVRERAQALYGPARCPIIPYQALDGANIEHTSIKLVHVTEETNETRNNEIQTDIHRQLTTPELAAELGLQRTDGDTYDVHANRQIFVGTLEGNRFQVQFSRSSTSGQWARTYWIWAQPEFGAPAWQALRHYRNDRREGLEVQVFAWAEQVHRLGAVVFVAQYRGSAARFRFVSAFDMNEPGGLYYLAQLPSKGKCESFDDALYLLAPPIVHRAREQGTPVFRQGDVFAIQIEHPDEWVYKDAAFIVRREVVMANHASFLARGRVPPAPQDHEVRERGTCPFCKCRPLVGNGTKARRALMIHGTGHTADEVVVQKNGVTFIRGTLRHDPALETPGREPEHRELPLQPSDAAIGEKWFLAVRNTVPRVRNVPQSVTEPAEETDPGRRANTNNARAEQVRQERSRQAAAAF